MAEAEGGSEQDDVSFLRTEDMVCLQCTATGERVCLAAEGFGNRTCFLENIADKNIPPDLSTCVFVIEQALSVRALQELVTAAAEDPDAKQGTSGSGHRTLLYGNAVLLRHMNSCMYLACLSTSSSSDKLAFDVGLQEHSKGEACWWTIHPASKQRSEGEKVRVGDDLILVSVATERYLHTARDKERVIVNASFHVTHWAVAPYGTGISRIKYVGCVFGGDVLRFFHGGDECLTIPSTWSEMPGRNIVIYEGGAVVSQARSLWRLELARTKWSGGFINWSHPMRIRHITTGRYLAVQTGTSLGGSLRVEDVGGGGMGTSNILVLVTKEEATLASSTFFLRQEKDDQKIMLEDKDLEIIGAPLIRYGDTTVILQHVESGLWLSYRTYETKVKGVGKVEEKQAILHEEGKMDDGLEFSRSQVEESRTARVIRTCGNLFNTFIKNLNKVQSDRRQSSFIQTIDLNEMIMCLEDLINYFAQPEEGIGHEEKQAKLRALRNRQDLFQEEGILNLILDAIDKINQITSQGYLVALAGDESGQQWEVISGYLYQLLAAVIKGNHTNCAQFAQLHRLNWLFSRLGSQASGEGSGMLDVLHCILIDSPEALNMMTEEHIKVIISLLEKHGRDPKVLDVLCSLCVGNGVAVRSSQNNICDYLLPGRDLLLQTQLVDHVASVQPNIYLGKVQGSAMYLKWYFEVIVDYIEQTSHLRPHLRIGWASTSGYIPYPGGGEKWGGNGVGDDLYSYGFDGEYLWTGGHATGVYDPGKDPPIQAGDVIGCALDLQDCKITFSFNGQFLRGHFANFNLDGMFFPVISCSAKISCRFLFGANEGKLKYRPPEGFSPLVESLGPSQVLRIEPCFYFGDLNKTILHGPLAIMEEGVFVPDPVDTTKAVLPAYVEKISEKLAENIHEVWAMGKIEQGWIYGDVRDDVDMTHPCLCKFELLPPMEKSYNITMAIQTLKTIIAMGYHISLDKPPARIKSVHLPKDPFLQPNGYKPAPLDLSAAILTPRLEKLIEELAQNTHNVWAHERVLRGWTYGVTEDNYGKRSPHLVPYAKLDPEIREANIQTAAEAIQTLLIYGYLIEPPSGDPTDMEVGPTNPFMADTRTYRAEKTYSVSSGKWYYEFEVLTAGPMRVGWAKINMPPGISVGSDENSWAFDGYNEEKVFGGCSETYGKQWQVGDIVGVMLDLVDKTISFSLNGELMMDSMGGETAFSDISGERFVPAFTFGVGQKAKVIFGQDIQQLKFFSSCGLQEGYQPFCVNMKRSVTLWYNKELPMFENIDDVNAAEVEAGGLPNPSLGTAIEVTRIPAGSDTPPSLKIAHKYFETMEKATWEFLRLSLPIACQNQFIDESEKNHRWQEIRVRQQKLKMERPALAPHDYQDQARASSAALVHMYGGYGDPDLERHGEGIEADEGLIMTVDNSAGNMMRHDTNMTVSQQGAGLLVPAQPDQMNHGRSPSIVGRMNRAQSEQALTMTEKAAFQADQAQREKASRRGMSPLRFFKRMREQSKERRRRAKTPDASVGPGHQQQVTERFTPMALANKVRAKGKAILQQPGFHITGQGPMRPAIPPRKHSLVGKGKQPKVDDGADLFDKYCLDRMDEYFIGFRIFPGQDPNLVYVGWVSTLYHVPATSFNPAQMRKVQVIGDDLVSHDRNNCWLVKAADLYNEVTRTEQGEAGGGKSASQGMFIGCTLDVVTGYANFYCDGKLTQTKFRMLPGAKVFPAIFVEATSKEMLQVELGRTQTTLPFSAAILKNSEKHIQPQMPPRLKVQVLRQFHWARVPNTSLKVHSLKLSEVRGWSMLCEDAVPLLALHIPEEDRCIDILEVIEHERLLNFHAQTLALYCALCYQSNYRAAHTLCLHVDQKQLLYAIQADYMSGPLRTGFYDLLIALHLESFAETRAQTNMEFLVPLSDELKELYEEPEMRHSLHSVATGSIRPQMTQCDITDMTTDIRDLSSPYVDLDVLKRFTIDALEDAVAMNQVHVRDQIGGSNANLFVPLLKLCDKLLLIGLFEDEDIMRILMMVDPSTWDHTFDRLGKDEHRVGLLQMKVAEGVKLQLCYILQHLHDIQLRHRIESLICFSEDYVKKIQEAQIRRYVEIKQSDLPSAVAAKKTREFRCPPREQMNINLGFKNLENEDSDNCPAGPELKEELASFHEEYMKLISVPGEESGEQEGDQETTGTGSKTPGFFAKIRHFFSVAAGNEDPPQEDALPDAPLLEEKFKKVLIPTLVGWAKQDHVEDSDLVREMFSLLLRQYNGVGEVMAAINNTYVFHGRGSDDVAQLLEKLSRVRSLLPVQMSPEEEKLVRVLLWEMVRNRVFFQHPDLMRTLHVHENVMAIMMNTLGRQAQQNDAQQQPQEGMAEMVQAKPNKENTAPADMVVACCRFLCYFCRASGANQRAMFEHLSFLIENSNILLSRPSLRGTTPLDVAYSAFMDNTELALALREHYLEKIAIYLARCGLQSNSELVAKGYPDIGWDPVEGERYLDFLRFCVWVSGESVEENANLVIRLLIRRPECLGPALRGEGEGLLSAIVHSNEMSEQISLQKNGKRAEAEALFTSHPMPESEEDEDWIDTGAAILNFYCTLVDLLGRCAPDQRILDHGKNEALRARSILRSLVPLEDLIGVLSLKFQLSQPPLEDGRPSQSEASDIPPGLTPRHKQSIVLFLERVYGIEEKGLFYRILEEAFLPDLRAATMLDKGDGGESEMALALNRYIGNSILPTLISHHQFFVDSEQYSSLLDASLHTVYKLSKSKILTKGQREAVSDFLLALTKEMQPSMLLKLLRKLTVDVSQLSEYTTVALHLLTLHYERCGRYYGAIGGQGSYGSASEEEKRLTMILFQNIFDSLAKMEYNPALFSSSLPCLIAIGCALPPDYTLTTTSDDDLYKTTSDAGPYIPQPIQTSGLVLSHEMENLVQTFSEHYHDAWALRKMEAGWTHGDSWNDHEKRHPRLKPYHMLSDYEKERYREPIRDALKALIALNWNIEYASGEGMGSQGSGMMGMMSSHQSMNIADYSPNPVDMTNLTLSKEMQNMAERLAEDAHDIWAKKKKLELDSCGGILHPQLVPYDLLTDKEKKKDRERATELLKYVQYMGFKLKRGQRMTDSNLNSLNAQGGSPVAVERRFAYTLLEKLLRYLDHAAVNMKIPKPSRNFSRRNSFRNTSKDVTFFNKVVMPLIEKYFVTHRQYFITVASATVSSGAASLKEKEMVAALFCRLSNLLRSRSAAFGANAQLCVKCLQVLVRGIDAKSLAKNCPEFIRTSMLNFFNCAAHDLSETLVNLEQRRVSHILGTHLKTCTSLNYVYMVLLPILSTLYDHLAANDYGADLLLGDIQVASYKILGGLFTLGKGSDLSMGRKYIINEFEVHRPGIGSCLGAFAAAFPVAFLEPDLAKNNPNSIHGKAADNSLEAQDVLAQLETQLPTLEKILLEIQDFVSRGGKHLDAPYIIDMYLPMLCAYLPYWWSQGPDNANPNETGKHLTSVTSDHMNQLLKCVLNLIKNNIGLENCPWMIRIAYSQQIIINSSETLLADPYLPLSRKVKQRVESVFHKEESMKGLLKSTTEDTSQIEAEIQEEWNLVVRDLYAFYPMLIKYVDLQRSHWLKHPSDEAEELYKNIAEIFNIWSKSLFFMKEEHSFVSQHEIDNMTLIMPAASGRRGAVSEQSSAVTASKSAKKKKKKKSDKDREKDKGKGSSLIVAALKRLLPVGLNLFAGRQQELVQLCKDKLLQKEAESDVQDFAKTQLTLPDKIDPSDEMSWQHILYAKLGSQQKEAGAADAQSLKAPVPAKLTPSQQTATLELTVSRIVAMSKVLFGLHTIDHPQTESKGLTRKIMTPQRKKAVIQCFRQISLHSLPPHRAINLFLSSYSSLWLSEENVGQEKVIEDLTLSFEESERLKKELSEQEGKPDPVTTLVRVFCHGASSEHSKDIASDDLYMKYAEIMARSCGEEEEEGEGEEEGEASIAEQEMQKQLLLFCQSRLASRGVAEMVLLYISACKGQQSDLVMATLKLGISVLRGGNIEIQRAMLNHLKETKDVGFFTSIAGLMNSCTVLDLDAFERNTKAEGLGGGPDGAAGQKNMHDSEFTCVLFRFIQLTCEGHNADWQNWLRSQAGNNTTVNVVICTVDYLLRLQESIMDFYWHYSSKELIDASGKANFFKAIGVASQVFNTLTEVIQGPCVQNQQALAHSRLWDAVGGFMFLFAHMQDKLSKHSSQIDLLTELMNLQKDMVVMMLSMLEGNVVNGTIGKQMVDTLVESASNVEMILKFFDMFLKLKDLTSSPSFQELDKANTGWITLDDFKEKMEQQKTYSVEEIDYILGCCEANVDGKINYIEFTEQFHNPAKEIGFNFAVLLTNLSEHMPSDARLSRFLETAGSVLNYFENVLGRIEICSGHKIERVYFEIDEDNIEQWEKPQIKESKRAFFYSIVTEGGDKEKLEAFVNFCEDAIFEMQHAASLMGESDSSQPTKAQAYTYTSPEEVPERTPKEKVWDAIKAGFIFIFGILALLSPSNIRRVMAEIKQMTPAEMAVGFLSLLFRVFFSCGKAGFWFVASGFGILMTLMKGPPPDPAEAVTQPVEEKMSFKSMASPGNVPAAPSQAPAAQLPAAPSPTGLPAIMGPPSDPTAGSLGASSPLAAGGISQQQSGDGHQPGDPNLGTEAAPEAGPSILPGLSSMIGAAMAGPEEDTMATEEAIAQQQALLAAEDQAKQASKSGTLPGASGASAAAATDEAPPVAQINVGDYTKRVLSFLGRNFYNLKYLALILAFCINFMLLFYRVSTFEEEDGGSGDSASIEDEILSSGSAELESSGEAGSGENGDDDDDGGLEIVEIDEKYFYVGYVLRILAALHILISVAMLIAYYHLKVPLAIFKREKEIARRLEFEGLWITGQPDDDDIKSHWDKLVISSRSFPDSYWDKFVKKKVRQKYSETYDFDAISVLLGMEKTSSFAKTDEGSTGILSVITGIDWRYQVWKAGVTITDSSFQYSLFYFTFSILGNFNYFFFAAHLLDVAVGFKTLRTILQSVTHNGKQLVLTLLLLTIVVYIYTVIAFNFFRKFYVQEEDEEVDQKCHDMLTCFVFHLYKGVRAGGGIGDEIEAPDGDDYEVYRIIFDITFFFFVIVILLAIIQGLIIDAFGELRDQLQSVQDDMESNCFICGIGKDYFDKIPHGFDTHVQKEHNLANYMFFLMYLISKPDTEYTGQETYVWNMYTQRCWDFFPVGDCFRKQYEEELSGAG